MARPRISDEALADLDEIWGYIAINSSLKAADRVIDRVYEAMKLLAERPGMGHTRKDLTDKPLRFWPVYYYLIVYRPDARPVEIVRVLSGYQDTKSLLGG